ncbi:helix-turn-helix domain-containing protein [Brevibacillus invocatus]|uniref:helix-turn-helix domain-containing protein n=1 Tax=Brevibacillus invocatus TaxID=173959 RepID=UPI0020416648|nr:helix-turn-helix transcriptional regulator [Brevibacillus invocatus]MCM3079577.1 helix-turn-helix domain-containing protein [Brevibacillus invocatus]MCM3429776.1 helix-turn-helix domain-containing protein [Brevibacillus invocatus]
MENKAFGRYLLEIRKRKALTTRDLAALSGVSQSYISHVESGRKGIPSPDILKKLATALEVPYIEMMDMAGLLPEEIKESEEYRRFTRLKKLSEDYNEATTRLSELDQRLEESNDAVEEAQFELNSLEKYYENPTLDLLDFLNFPFITYKDQQLTAEDRQRIIDMLRLMFPDRK